MNSDTINRLIELNRLFYQTFAQPFSQTRRRLQPGVLRIFNNISTDKNILDLGCGNGELWRTIKQKGCRAKYIGVDFSLELLQAATEADASAQLITPPIRSEQIVSQLGSHQACFLQADLCTPNWEEPIREMKFGLILSFASLHHMPGRQVRSNLISKVHRLLSPNGLFAVSVWQFLNHPRFGKRIQSWETVGLTLGLVDSGDYLLDWKYGGYGYRYVHHFQEDELSRIAEEHGFRVKETFHSDGEGGRLSLYQIWEK